MSIGAILGAIGGTFGKFFTVLAYVPTVIALVEQIAGIIGKNKIDGQGKHDLAIALVRQAIVSGEGFTGKEILDQDLFAAGLDKVVHGIVDCLNSTGKGWGDVLFK